MYRWAKPADKKAVMDLWAIDFESYEPYYSWYFNNVYHPKRTLCDFAGPVLAAAVQLAPYTLSIQGQKVPVCYMVGVITNPAFRGKGRGRALLQEAHKRLEKKGYLASLLYTDIPGFYRPLGYEHCYFRQNLSLPVTKEEPCLPPAKNIPVQQGDIKTLAHIYQATTAYYNGYIVRKKRNWQIYLGEQACDKARLLLWPKQAYVLYTIDKDKLHIIELGFCHEDAARNALQAAINVAYKAKVNQLLWGAPPNGPQIFSHIPACCWQLSPFVMARSRGLIKPFFPGLWINEYT